MIILGVSWEETSIYIDNTHRVMLHVLYSHVFAFCVCRLRVRTPSPVPTPEPEEELKRNAILALPKITNR